MSLSAECDGEDNGDGASSVSVSADFLKEDDDDNENEWQKEGWMDAEQCHALAKLKSSERLELRCTNEGERKNNKNIK